MTRRGTIVRIRSNHRGVPTMAHVRSATLVGAWTVVAASITGCAAPQRAFSPSTDPASMTDVAFTHYLPAAPVVTVDEGLRAVLMLDGDTHRWPTPRERRLEALRRGWIDADWPAEPDRVLDKGTLAHVLMVRCDLPRSINDRFAEVVGVGRRRYAIKTCVDAGLMPYATSRQPVTGGELHGALVRTESYGAGSTDR